MGGSFTERQAKPYMSDADRIPAETAKVLQSFFSSKKTVCEDSTRLVIQMDGWPGFFVGKIKIG